MSRPLFTPAGHVLIIALLASSCSKSSPPPAAEGGSGASVPTSTTLTLTASDLATARLAMLTDAVSISGPLEPVQTVAIKTQINAIVRAVRADRGSHVRRGEVLVELDAEGLRGQAASAKAAIAAADANLDLARQRVVSARRLESAGAISSTSRKTLDAAYELALAQAAAARAQFTSSSESESRATIVSPLDGIVSDRTVEMGEAVKDGGVLFTIVDTRTLELRAQVDVDEAMRVRPGAAVVFTLDAAPGQTLRGVVTRIDPRADPATRKVGVASSLPNNSGSIVAGQFAHGRVLTGAPAAQVVVPISAISDSSGHASVFVIQNNRLTRRSIMLGVRDEAQGLVAVKSGLTAGERVLAVPVLGAAEGLVVSIATDTTKSRTPPPTGKPK